MRTRSAHSSGRRRIRRRGAVLLIAGLIYALGLVLFPCADAIARYAGHHEDYAARAMAACSLFQPAQAPNDGTPSCCVVERDAAIDDMRAVPSTAGHDLPLVAAACVSVSPSPVALVSKAAHRPASPPSVPLYLRNLRLLN